MKFTISWLNRYCKAELPTEDLAEKLTMSGTEVENIEQIGSQTVLTLEVTSNRPDLLGVLGIAREVSALTGTPLVMPETGFALGDAKAESLASVTNEAEDLCSLYTAKIISGVRVGPSPDWLKDLLIGIGLRPVNNIVDVTNFIMMETGQPLHAFDLDRLKEKRIVVRRARAGETLTSIDGSECKLSPEDLVIADGSRPVAVAGVMGGLETEVSEGTTDILLESALFAPLAVRQTSRRLALTSESSYRFERGVTPGTVALGSDRACRLILELAGGTAAKGTITAAGSSDFPPVIVTMRWSRLNKLLGVDVPRDEAASILANLGFVSKETSDEAITVGVPDFRRDIEREVDLIEEVSRVWGYDRIPGVSTMKIAVPFRDPAAETAAECRRVITGAGYFEVITSSFVGRTSNLWNDADSLSLKNPVRENEPLLRKSLIASVLEIVRYNENRGRTGTGFFELARVYLPTGEQLPAEKTMLTAFSPDGFFALKGVLQQIFSTCGVSCTFESADSEPFEAGRASVVTGDDGVRMAWIGDVSEQLLEQCKLKQKGAIFEIDTNTLGVLRTGVKKYSGIPAFPALVRDYAVILDEKVLWGDVERSVRSSGTPLVSDLVPFDTYRSDEIGVGRKSIAFSVTYRVADRTLTGSEVDEVQDLIIKRLTADLGAVLRS